MLQTGEQLYHALLVELAQANTEQQVYQCKSKFLGRNGSITRLVKQIPTLPLHERAVAGRELNRLKSDAEQAIEKRLRDIIECKKQQQLQQSVVDVTLPGRTPPLGALHPITLTTRNIVSIFAAMGFSVVEGPEIELDFFNFEALNIPKDHPARDMHDTFYIDDEILLRTHTSPVQIRTMQDSKPPLRIICPGKVYRCDSDISHTPMFHQVEGLLVDCSVSLSDLKGVLIQFLHNIFDAHTAVRFRPSFFPFTEPSAEVDIACVMCKGTGCRVCSGTGWLEILGCGMVHPAVFRNVGYDPETVSGFAFGLGVERIAMLLYGINDIRLFFENDIRFLSQFI
ncbi:MAG: phenylalanine--tRNA ligase subunit alpha [Desulfobacterota bacterium]|nr:phenylalanine--tRNA ligase subunit alpha [Thermodesulfobacteriota bacterium]